MQLLLNDQSGVAAMGLLPYIALRRDAHRFKGLGEAELAASAVGFKHSDLLMDLKRNGQRAFVKPSFRPNGGRNFRQSKSYNDNSALCNKHIFKLLTAGKAVIVRWDSLSPAEQSVIHVNTLQLAASSNLNREGRCCINMSYRTPLSGHRGNGQSSKLMSINEGTDLVERDQHYHPSTSQQRRICASWQKLSEQSSNHRVRISQELPSTFQMRIDNSQFRREQLCIVP